MDALHMQPPKRMAPELDEAPLEPIHYLPPAPPPKLLAPPSPKPKYATKTARAEEMGIDKARTIHKRNSVTAHGEKPSAAMVRFISPGSAKIHMKHAQNKAQRKKNPLFDVPS